MKRYLLNKRLILVFAILLLPVSLAFGQASQNVSNKHILWKVTSPSGEVNYLAGSVHLMRPNIYPLDDVYQQVFKKSEQLVFELNMDSLKANRMRLIQKYAMLPQGTTLKEKVSPSVYHLLEAKLDSLGLPASRFQQFKPFFVSIAIMDVKLLKSGFQPSAGIDMHFFNKAQKAGKQIIGLETPAFQMRLLSTISEKFTNSFVKHNLQKAGQLIKNIDKIVTKWKHGNAAALDSLIHSWKENNPEVYKKVVLDRNRNWMPTIKKLFNNGKTTWVITGAGHMVGKNGVVAMLRRAGYKVVQL